MTVMESIRETDVGVAPFPTNLDEMLSACGFSEMSEDVVKLIQDEFVDNVLWLEGLFGKLVADALPRYRLIWRLFLPLSILHLYGMTLVHSEMTGSSGTFLVTANFAAFLMIFDMATSVGSLKWKALLYTHQHAPKMPRDLHARVDSLAEMLGDDYEIEIVWLKHDPFLRVRELKTKAITYFHHW